MRSGENLWEPIELNDQFCTEDQIRVLEFSRLGLQFDDETVVRLEENTTVIIPAENDPAASWLEIIIGAVHVILRTLEGDFDPRPLNVVTPYANAGIEGTEFLLEVANNQSFVVVFEGTVALSNAAGALQIASGQSAVAAAGVAPSSIEVVSPRDAVQWTLYYPTIIDSIVAAADQPDNQQANDPLFFTQRASQRLISGNVDEASADLLTALQLDANNSTALALQAIIAVTQNDKPGALNMAERAVAIDTGSATALLSLSYARQAHFDNEGARNSLQSAADQNPGNALVWARLAELNLALGELDSALTAAQQAVALNPNVSLSQTILGFAFLAQLETSQAEQAFERAIELDSASPLSRLGLGLVMIREGDLQGGRNELGIAVILDPGNSLVRSYIGKAYYEENRDELAAGQLEIAKQLDPLDPTPWFYDAIRQQTSNKPIDALRNLQQSIDLNDNRAVYRSQLLLDEDLAARSSSLGRIYRDLGFERLALSEGWKSVQADSSNFSGHRLLADVYSSEPRHQIARVNELFQSQLLQPANVTPVQPQLAEPNIFILDSAGPTELALNEFNPLFIEDGFTGQISATLGSNDTVAHDIVFSGVQGKWSFNVGEFQFESNGFRENNDLEQEIGTAFVQYRPTNKTSLQAEIRSVDTENGDLPLFFDPDNFSADFRQDVSVDSARFGANHSFSDRSKLLGSVMVQDVEAMTDIPPIISVNSDFDTAKAELQHHYRGDDWQLTSGLSYMEFDEYSVSKFVVPLPFPPFSFENTTIDDRTQKFRSAYVYGSKEWEKLTLNIGGSADSLSGGLIEKDSFNPKLGIVWTPLQGTTVRVAAFKTLQGPVISKLIIQPRLEPTQVAGFNQFYFDSIGTKVWNYGAALEQDLRDNLYAGIEYSRRERDFTVITGSAGPLGTTDIDSEEDLVRGYAYWTPHSSIAISAELQHEKFDNNGQLLSEAFTKVKMFRLPVQVSYFQQSTGLSYSIKSTYVEQDGTFLDPSPAIPGRGLINGEDEFWVLDASIDYRFPARNGSLALKASNLSDEEFYFQDTEPDNPGIFPEQFLSLTLTLRF